MKIHSGSAGGGKTERMRRERTPTHYDTIGVRPNATVEEIHRRVRILGRQLHPDLLLQNAAYAKRHAKCALGKSSEGCVVCGSAERWKRITYAFSILKETALRRKYDAELELRGTANRCDTCKGEGEVFSTGRGFAKIRKTCPTCNGSGRKETEGEAQGTIKL